MFTKAEAESLNAFQQEGCFHPFTCGNCRSVLVATEDGWHCPNCDYRQAWAHDIMKNGGLAAACIHAGSTRKAGEGTVIAPDIP